MGSMDNCRSNMAWFLDSDPVSVSASFELEHLRHQWFKALEWNKRLFLFQLTTSIHPITQDVAAYIKREFDKKYNPTWHVIVGRNFGSYVTHETKHFIYFYLGQVAILLFKSG